jgi:uncharacterized membrane protein YfcA
MPELPGGPAPELVLAFGVFSGAVVTGFAGFGFAAAAGAFLMHVLDLRVALPLMMLCSVLAQGIGLLWLGRRVHFQSSVPFLGGGLLGLPLAILLLSSLDAATLRRAFGLFLVAYAAWTLLQSARLPRLPGRRIADAAALPPPPATAPGVAGAEKAAVGFVAGLIGGMTAMPGALIAVWSDLRGLPGDARRAVLQPFILAMQIVALGLMAATPGLLTAEVFGHVRIALPPLLAGTALGLLLHGRAGAVLSRHAILLAVLASGAALVSR